MDLRSAEAISVSKTVPEMAANGEPPPLNYHVKDTRFGSVESSPPLCPVTVIDMSHLSQSSQSSQELDKLSSALRNAGFFQLIGHGMSDSFLDKVREVAVKFFKQPEEEKQKYARAVDHFEGYGSDIVVSDKQVLDWSQRLMLSVLPVETRSLNLWPQNPPEFCEILNEYAMKLMTVTEVLFKAIAKSLNLEENTVLNLLRDEDQMQVRFNFYPPCSRPDLVFGVKPHTDKSAITILLQDSEIEGLQILIDGKWYRVPLIPHALVVNVGDQMEIITNGIYKSPLHRVVTNEAKLRISIASLIEPGPETEIGPVNQLISDERPKLYKNVKDYSVINYTCYQKGLVALETVKL